jgi:hypothetical protein
VGGWVDTTTLQKCYQAPDLETMEAVVLNPRAGRRVQARFRSYFGGNLSYRSIPPGR